VPLGHRFRALKLWFVLRYFGRERIEAMLRQHIAWAQKLAALVDADPKFERVAPVPFSVVCFRYRGTSKKGDPQGVDAQRVDDQNKAILDRVNQSGRVFLSSTVLNGQTVLRLAIGNLATTWPDIQEAWDLLRRAADEV